MTSGRVYTVSIPGTASPAAAFDLFELVPATAKPIALLRLRIAQTSEPTSEEEQLGLTITRGTTSSGSGGSTPAAVPVCSTDAAAGFTPETMNTTQASGGTPVTLFEDAWNTRAGVDIAFAPEEGLNAVNGERLVVKSAAPADAVTIRATLWFMELG
jgi:hypothetical protein